ncbi:putative interleukin-17 receptor E-like [Syngnathoides biaculeatus]|uniref:putative interleukin-17 receptor E-like n=1 Tax=Syngnathoides biaculeatus TaxID=300417 RepID=UPI002ADDB88A|nr:putative interleukin-17 receptor E-like [Syngnathoides biaculeatus]XP_061662889.1 putative interleukin-17 receptor E-like [Syngnathoides biaculeatus]XP_061662890.1 putative interleukin-17 receptor E-like [Syngnathoides biaculeatus]
MMLWAALLAWYCGLSLFGAAAELVEAERIQTCGTRCSQGLQCKTKPAHFVPPPCQKAPERLDASSVFRNLSFSSVVRCEGRQRCSLHLRVKTSVRLAESVHGLSVCFETPGMLQRCQVVSLLKASRRKMAGMQVEVENDCVGVHPGQQARVTVTAFPSYCGLTRSSTYVAPDCSWKDLRRLVPECITGRISHDVDLERKEVRVGVSNALQGHDYRVRLCHKDFICTGTGDEALIKKEEPKKSVVLTFSRPLPCLCIEGWSAVIDAPRVQVCPFKDRTEEMWHGIRFDPLGEALSWEPACPISGRATLCQRGEDGDGGGGGCSDLEGAERNITRGKITFAKVDPHPQLCMKFTVGDQSRIRCPFVKRFQAWDVSMTQQEATLTSLVNATFAVSACAPSQGSAACRAAGATHTTVHVGEHSSVGLNLTDVRACVYVRRIDVKYASTVLHCFPHRATQAFPVLPARAALDSTPLSLWLGAGVLVASSALLVTFTVYQRRKHTEI